METKMRLGIRVLVESGEREAAIQFAVTKFLATGSQVP
jgi:hypothetical protein